MTVWALRVSKSQKVNTALPFEANSAVDSFGAISVHWAPDGGSAAVCDKNAFCLVYEEAPDEGVENDKWDEV
jgi:hypothetical protein